MSEITSNRTEQMKRGFMKIMRERFEICAQPRNGYKVGDTPYAQYSQEELSVADEEKGLVEYFPVGDIKPGDIVKNRGHWLAISTQSGSDYFLKVLSDGDSDDAFDVVGIRLKANHYSDQAEYIIGRVVKPSVHGKLIFIEHKRYKTRKGFEAGARNVCYASNEAYTERIGRAFDKTVTEQGMDWLGYSLFPQNIRDAVNPKEEELESDLVTTEIEAIKLGISKKNL